VALATSATWLIRHCISHLTRRPTQPLALRDVRISAAEQIENIPSLRLRRLYSKLEVCMGMGKTGIPWDSHGNGNKISHGMGMGREWELSAWEWELTRGSCHQQL